MQFDARVSCHSRPRLGGTINSLLDTILHPPLLILLKMAYMDRTADFKENVRKRQASLPDTDRRRSAPDRQKQSRERDPLGKEYVSEAYKIVRKTISACNYVD